MKIRLGNKIAGRVLAASLLAFCSLSAAAQAKYIFYFIGDGMGMGHVNTTQTYLRDVLKAPEPLLMTTFPVASQARTFSYDSPITDSAAAGTALSTGHKTVNGRVAMGPDSVNYRSIAADFLAAGFATGVATSVAGDDATPAAFYAHALGRDESENIAPCAVESGLSFLAGGNFKIAHTPKWEQWLDDMQKKGGYRIVRSLAELDKPAKKGKAKGGEKILFLPELSVYDQIGFTIDSIPGATPLRDITEACIRTVSSNNPDRFFVMIEGGNIDWAAHANDGAAVIKEIMNFQQSIDQAYQFYLQHPDETLIVVTADHDTGGMALGREDNRKHPDLSLIDYQRISKDRFNQWIEEMQKEKHTFTWPEMEETLRDKFGLWKSIPLNEKETADLRAAFRDTFETGTGKDTETWYQSFKEFTVKLYDLVNRRYGIGWTTSSHTGNMVPVYVIGAGQELFTGSLDNTRIPMLIKQAAEIK